MPKIHAKEKKRKVLMRQQRGRCWLCGEPMPTTDVTFDHVIPRSKLGGRTWDNLKLAHRLCNIERGDSLDQVFTDESGIVALRWNVRSIP